MPRLHVSCLLGLSVLAQGCQRDHDTGTLSQMATGTFPFLSTSPLKSCKEEEQSVHGSGFASSPQGARANVQLPKSKAYLQSMFRYIVEQDAKQAVPIFRGNFAPDNFCFAITADSNVNAFMSPATGLMTFTSGMLLLRPQITHWRTTGHELGHALLGHFEDYPKTTFPVPSAANEQLIRQVGNKISARMHWLLADMARFRSFSNATMTEYFRTRFVKAAQGRANLVWGDILLALLQELQPEPPQGAPPQTPQQRSYDTLENESVVLSLLALTAPDTVIEPQGKDFLTRMMSLRLDTLKQLRALEEERLSVLRQSYPPEYLSNGNEQAADFVGDWLMDRSGLHPGISAASWLAEMIAGPGIDAKQQRAFEEWQRSGDPSAALAVFPPYFLACLNHTDSGDTVWPGLETHPNDCFRFQSLLDRKGRDPALLSGDIEATLPPVSPSLDEVQEELIEAYAQAGMPLPTNLRD